MLSDLSLSSINFAMPFESAAEEFAPAVFFITKPKT
jgi:hypothetical protein